GEIGPGDGDFPPVQRDAAPGALLGVAVKITAVEDDVVRQHFFGGLATVARPNQVVEKGSGSRMEFAAGKAVVMRAGLRRHNPILSGYQLRHSLAMRGFEALARCGQRAIGSVGANRDPVVAILDGELKRAGKDGAGCELNYISGLRFAERLLQVAISRHGNGACLAP